MRNHGSREGFFFKVNAVREWALDWTWVPIESRGNEIRRNIRVESRLRLAVPVHGPGERGEHREGSEPRPRRGGRLAHEGMVRSATCEKVIDPRQFEAPVLARTDCRRKRRAEEFHVPCGFLEALRRLRPRSCPFQHYHEGTGRTCTL